MNKKKIVIVGGGFGGIYVTGGLRKSANRGEIEVTLISPQNYFLFTPLLHEVATGGLSPLSVAEPIREIFRKDKIKFCQSGVEKINTKDKTIKTENRLINYDILVLATGAETNFYKIPGAKEYGLPLKTLRDSVVIRSRIIDAFEQAALVSDENLRKKFLTFVVVGGGATGVELAGELSEFVFQTLASYYQNTFCKAKDIRVVLISGSEQILKMFPKSMRFWSEKVLLKKGVQIINNKHVAKLSESEVVLDNGESIESRTVLWTAGVMPKVPDLGGSLEFDKTGRVLIQKDLRVAGHPDLFVLGDCAAEDQPLPMFAQVAVKQSEIVVKNIKNLINGEDLEVFNFRPKGFLVSLGQWRAVGTVFGLGIQGRLAWWLWRTIYLFKFISWRKKFRIAFEWTLNLFYPRDTTKIG